MSGRSFALALIAAALLAACGGAGPQVIAVAGGDQNRGRDLIDRYGCAGCHSVRGTSARGQVGPPLDGVAGRAYVGGILPNTTSNMIAWIRHPQQFAPGTAMPDLGVSEPDARDMTAYLYTLK